MYGKTGRVAQLQGGGGGEISPPLVNKLSTFSLSNYELPNALA